MAAVNTDAPRPPSLQGQRDRAPHRRTSAWLGWLGVAVLGLVALRGLLLRRCLNLGRASVSDRAPR